MKLNEHFAAFLEQLAGQSTDNRRLYRQRLSGFLETHGDKEPQEISQSDVNNWLRVLDTRGYADATKAGHRQALKAFMAWLQKEETLDQSPAAHIKVGKYTSRRVKRPPEHAVRACATIAESWIRESNLPGEVRDAAIFMLSMEGGPPFP